MGTFGPATLAAGLLADLGMEVIRIEPPLHPSRITTRSKEEDGDGIPAPPGGVPWQRNKQSIVLNLKMPEAREIFYRLAKGADVVIEANRPGVLKKLGADYQNLKKCNPQIIYCSVTGFGQTGPYIHKPGHDACWQGVGGMLSLTALGLGNLGNPRNGPPAIPSRLVTHHTTPYYCAMAILSALWVREFTQEGQQIDISNCDAVVGVANHPPRSLYSGKSAAWNVYESKDGKYIAIGAKNVEEWENLCRLLHREEYIGQWEGNEVKQAEMAENFSKIFKTKTREEWWDLFKKDRIAGAPVYRLDEVEEDPQVQCREMLPEFNLSGRRRIKQYGIPIKFSMTPGQVRFLARSYGENADSILKKAGYSEEEISTLKTKGAVQ